MAHRNGSGQRHRPSATWGRWATTFSHAPDAESVRSALRETAADLVLYVGRGGDLASLGIELHRAVMSGRNGGIHDRWDWKAVVVDEREPPLSQCRIVAHEVAHLLLAYVNRQGLVAMPRHAQEHACDDFADAVIAGLEAYGAGALALLSARPGAPVTASVHRVHPPGVGRP